MINLNQGRSRGNERADSGKDSISTWIDGQCRITKRNGRRCKHPRCDTIMSQYNVSDRYCYVHQKEEQWR